MYAFALLICVGLAGIAAQAALSRKATGRLELSRLLCLVVGLLLVIPTMGRPLALLEEVRHPNPLVQSFNLPLAFLWGLGLCLVVRSALGKPRMARLGQAACPGDDR